MTSKNVVQRRSDASTHAPAPPDRSSPPDYLERIAEFPGTCPICSRYIRAGRSHIAPLDVAIPPDPATLYYNAQRRSFIRLDGNQARMRDASWAHAACLRRAGDIHNQIALADERRDELKRIRRAAGDDRPRCRPRKGRQS